VSSEATSENTTAKEAKSEAKHQVTVESDVKSEAKSGIMSAKEAKPEITECLLTSGHSCAFNPSYTCSVACALAKARAKRIAKSTVKRTMQESTVVEKAEPESQFEITVEDDNGERSKHRKGQAGGRGVCQDHERCLGMAECIDHANERRVTVEETVLSENTVINEARSEAEDEKAVEDLAKVKSGDLQRKPVTRTTAIVRKRRRKRRRA